MMTSDDVVAFVDVTQMRASLEGDPASKSRAHMIRFADAFGIGERAAAAVRSDEGYSDQPKRRRRKQSA